MGDFQRKLNTKLVERVAAVLAEVELRRDERATAEFWGLWNAINGAAARLGLPCDDTPVTRRPSDLAIAVFLDNVVAEGRERGGELAL